MIEPENVAAVLLAAGRSLRFGEEDKLLAHLRGVPLVAHAARAIESVSPGRKIAICPDTAGPVAALLAARGFEIVANGEAERGLSQSLARGIAVAGAARHEAALICLADMPNVTPDHLRAVMARFHPVTVPVVGSIAGENCSPPALFGRSLFARIALLEGDKGAKAMLAEGDLVQAPEDLLVEVDRPGDLAAV